MAQGHGGSIVNTASVGGLLAFLTAGPYVASKRAVLGLTKTAAIECGRYGIRVNPASPGAIRTEMLLEVFGTQEALDEMNAVHPIGRIGRPEEIADAVVWLFTDRSSYYTGQSLTLDGGLTAQRPYATQSAWDNSFIMLAMGVGEWVLRLSKSRKIKTSLGRDCLGDTLRGFRRHHKSWNWRSNGRDIGSLGPVSESAWNCFGRVRGLDGRR
jgi:hypothetical protein